MDPTRYFIKGRTCAAGDPGLQDALARLYGSSERPRCMCVHGGVEMYLVKHAEYVVKRMPDTGSQHHPTCTSFEPEPGASGLGELLGEAIIEHSPDQVEVRIDFPISRLPGRANQRGEAIADPAGVHASRKRISLRTLLHYLYQRAGFNRWYPAMEGRRNQGVLQKYLTEAAAGVIVKGAPFDERLYVPEPFRAEIKEEIGERRRRKLGLLLSSKHDVQFKMAILVGEYNGSEPTNFWRRIAIRHMPDVPLFMEHKAWGRVERIHGAILQARDADVARKPRALMAALIYTVREHVYAVDTPEHDIDYRSVDSGGRPARVAVGRGVAARTACIHEAAQVRRPDVGDRSSRTHCCWIAAGRQSRFMSSPLLPRRRTWH